MFGVDGGAKAWEQALGRRIGAAVHQRRNELGWSTQRLAEVTARLGYPLSRVTISTIEANARSGKIDVAELVVLSAALFVSPIQLLYPDLVDGKVELLPGRQVSSIQALEWFCGNAEPLRPPPGDSARADRFGMWEAGSSPIALARRIHELRRMLSAEQHEIDSGATASDASSEVRDEIAELAKQARQAGLVVDGGADSESAEQSAVPDLARSEPLLQFGSMDALMMAAERLGSAMHVGVVLLMAPPADVDPRGYVDDLYRDSMLGTHSVEPRLRRRFYQGVDSRGALAWRELPQIDLSKHVFRETLPPGSDMATFWRRVSELHSERLDLAAPMWACHIFDGLPGGRFALYIKVHHTIIDGVGGLRMIQDSLSPDPDRRGMLPFFADKGGQDRVAEPRADKQDQSGRQSRLPNPLAAVRAIADVAAAGLDLTRRIATAELATVIGSMVSDAVVPPFSAPHTRFNNKLGPQRTATGTILDRGRIRAVQEAADVTANDVITAVIGGTLRSWLIERDELPEKTLVAMCPVSVRDREGADAKNRSKQSNADRGNQFGLGLCPLGTNIADPAERLALVHDAMDNIKREVLDNGSDAMLVVMGPAIGSTVAFPYLPFGSLLPTSSNMAISNVPGPREEMYFNGAHLEAIYPVSGVYDGLGINVTVCSYADRVGVGYVTDPVLIPDIGELVGLTEQAFAELEAAFGI